MLRINLRWEQIDFFGDIPEQALKTYLISKYLIDNELTRNLVSAELSIMLHQNLQNILPGLILIDTNYLAQELDCTYEYKIELPDFVLELYGNSVTLTTKFQQDLLKLEQQLFLKLESIKLTAPSLLSGNTKVRIFDNDYYLSVAEQQMVNDAKIKDECSYLHLTLEVNNFQLSLYISKNIIAFFAKLFFIDIKLNHDINVIYMVIDLLICYINDTSDLKIILHDYKYTQLPLEIYYHKFYIEGISTDLVGIIFIPTKQVARYTNSLSDIFSRESKHVVDNTLMLTFPLNIAESAISSKELKLLQIGEVIILDRNFSHYGANNGTGEESAILELGNAQLLVQIVNHQTIKILDKFYG